MSPNKRAYTYRYAYGDNTPPPSQATPPKNKKPKRRTGLRRFLALLLLILIIIGALYAFSRRDRTVINNNVANVVTTVTESKPAGPTAAQIKAQKVATMGNQINAIIAQNTAIDMSVSLIDMNNNNQLVQYGDATSFTAASTTKVITAADFLQEVQNGQQSLNETVNGATAEYELQQMIVVSDDNAWDALNDTLGNSQLQSYAHGIGLSSFQVLPNTVTSNDMALLLQKLYEGQLLNQSNTQLLLSWMKEANYTQYIVPAVPSTDTIYHKVGFYGGDLHDEAIIVDGNQSFVIVIFTYGPTEADFPARALVMQQIAKDALTAYF